MNQTIHLTRPAAHVAHLRIDNPPSNALGDAVRRELLPILEELESDLEIRAVILTGTGKAFCSGDDLREVQARGADSRASLARFGAVLGKVEDFRVPVIAAVNGHAMGGGLELALCCDIRIAVVSARFAGAGVNVGLMASVYRLPRLIGIARAKAMLLTGMPTDAATALAYGLVTSVHAPSELEDGALALATRIASRAPLSVEATKRQTARAFDLTPENSAKAAGEELKILSASSDHKAAIAAFLEKREPKFTRS